MASKKTEIESIPRAKMWIYVRHLVDTACIYDNNPKDLYRWEGDLLRTFFEINEKHEKRVLKEFRYLERNWLVDALRDIYETTKKQDDWLVQQHRKLFSAFAFGGNFRYHMGTDVARNVKHFLSSPKMVRESGGSVAHAIKRLGKRLPVSERSLFYGRRRVRSEKPPKQSNSKEKDREEEGTLDDILVMRMFGMEAREAKEVWKLINMFLDEYRKKGVDGFRSIPFQDRFEQGQWKAVQEQFEPERDQLSRSDLLAAFKSSFPKKLSERDANELLDLAIGPRRGLNSKS
jgi:hypothetical protein